MENILPWLVFLPLVFGFILLFVPKKYSLLGQITVLVISLMSFIFAVIIFFADESLEYTLALLDTGPVTIDLLLKTSALNRFILLFAMGFGVLITIYSIKTAIHIVRIQEYYGALLLAIGGSAGILLSNHLFFLLLFWEIVTAALYLLIASGGKHTNFAATKSFAMIGASDGAFLLGIAMVWRLQGTFVISDISIETSSALSIVAFLLLMLAAITKAGALPLHTWLPTSGEYVHASVMAILPAALDKLLGIYLLVLIVHHLFILNSPALAFTLAVIGSATVIIAVMIAMVQHNVKKLLSYHAISQVGYMILGIATMTPVGMAGGVFHMLNHAIYKCCLFLCGGAVEESGGTAELDKLGGLGKKMPLTFATCLIAALSISGVPPFNGFASKWMVYQGIIQMGTESSTQFGGAAFWPIWLVAAMFGSALTLASFVKIIHSIFLSRLPSTLNDVKEVSPLMGVPMAVLALLCIFFGVFYQLPLKWFIYPALNIEADTAIFGHWDSSVATVLMLVGLLLGGLILYLGFIARKARSVHSWVCGETEIDSDCLIIPGSSFYKTVSSLGPLKGLYAHQEKGSFDLYNVFGKLGGMVTGLLKWAHSGDLGLYLTWIILGFFILLFRLCHIW